MREKREGICRVLGILDALFSSLFFVLFLLPLPPAVFISSSLTCVRVLATTSSLPPHGLPFSPSPLSVCEHALREKREERFLPNVKKSWSKISGKS